MPTSKHIFRQKRNKQTLPLLKAKYLETNRLSLSYKTSSLPQFQQFGLDVSPRTIGPAGEPHHLRNPTTRSLGSPDADRPETTRSRASLTDFGRPRD